MRANNTLTVPEREILARRELRREQSELRSWAAGRKAERQRIAQDLHDTLLQGFLSASLQLHVAVDRLPEDWPGKPQFRHILQVMRCVIDEGRSAIQGLRSSDVLDLEQAFLRVQWEFARQSEIAFCVTVAGRPRRLREALTNEVYSIGREAIVNAYRHSLATTIEAEIEYAPNRLLTIIRDNGCGIDQGVLRSGRPGHWGLQGIRERAERIGGRVRIRRVNIGTEVELCVPGQIAFQEATP
jgi:signal transduction histidine kinase